MIFGGFPDFFSVTDNTAALADDFLSKIGLKSDAYASSAEQVQNEVQLSDDTQNSAQSILDDSNIGIIQSMLQALQTSALSATNANYEDYKNYQSDMLDKQYAYNAAQAELNRQFQQTSADKAMAFEAEQNATQYQRAVADLKAAGLNPILAVSQGGNTSASGYAASGSSSSGSTQSGTMADWSSAKNADNSFLKTIIESVSDILSGVFNIFKKL